MTATAKPTTKQTTKRKRAANNKSPVLIQKTKHLHKMTPGWLFPYLVQVDATPLGTGRWAYWHDTLMDLQLLDEPIPQIDFGKPHRDAVRNIVNCLDYAERYGQRHAQAFSDFVVWLLHGFGDPKFRQYATPDQIQGFRIGPEVLDYWYETFDLSLMIRRPADYMAHFAQGGENGDYNPYKGSAFFATPIELCRLIADILQCDTTGDGRTKTVCDPCCGTGSLLLVASNHSLRLYGQDISYDMVNCCKVNMYLYAPWGVWWPDFSTIWPFLGLGPTPEQCRQALFGAETDYTAEEGRSDSVTLNQTNTGQYVMPGFFEEET